ncbi:hypothetical protein CEE44_04025 [Candidatus Woesearchaeota archaeon B3_Woes]|nr:MAG: hypothetical protein CEE44_04025 [Candidatus Woesearchaeota archaeon B3_Woes]
MRRKVCMSKGLLYNPYLKEDFNKSIKRVSKLDIDGFEFLVGDARDLLKFKIKKSSIKILKDLDFNTVHAPFDLGGKEMLFSKNNATKKILDKLYHIYDKIDAVNLNIHPQQITNFKVFNIKDYQHSIENMEKYHGFKIKDYAKILKDNESFKLVLDTSHSSEEGTINNLFKRFRKDIIYSHLSASYFNHLHLPLHSLRLEYIKGLEIIKKGKFPIVLESQIGAKDIDEYEKEISFVRKWLNS